MTWFTDMAELHQKAQEIWRDVYAQLGEIASQTGCEAGARRAFHDGRFATLKELGLLNEANAVAATDEEIRKRRLDLDDSLRERGKSRPDRDPIAFEPIVRRDDDLPRIECRCGALLTLPPTGERVICACGRRYDRAMTKPESTEETAAAAEAVETEDAADDAVEADDVAEPE